MTFVRLCNAKDIPKGAIKAFEINDKNILVSNIDGDFFAINNRCAHMNALLSMGKVVNKDRIICPLHYAQFNLKTGEKVKEPNFKEPTFMGRTINFIITNVVHRPEVVNSIKTYNIEKYKIKIENDEILIDI